MNNIGLEPGLMEFLEGILRQIVENKATHLVVVAGNDDDDLIFGRYQAGPQFMHKAAGLIQDRATIEYLRRNADELEEILNGDEDDENSGSEDQDE